MTSIAIPTPHSDTLPTARRHIARRHLAGLILVLLVAAFARMSDLGRLTDYAYDQATLSTLALDLVNGKSIPTLGIQSSAGIPNSPMTVYVLAIPYLFTDDPQVVTMIIAAFNVFGVGLLWYLGYRYFGPRIALLAALAYALHPHAIHYSRSIWAQDYHTPILLLALLAALEGYLEGKRWGQIAMLPLFLIGAQIHYAAWTLLPALLWIVLRGRQQIDWRATGLGILIGIATLVPFAVGLSQATDAASATALDVVDRLDSLILRNKALLYLARLMTGLGGPWVGMPLIGAYDVVLEFPSAITLLWLVPAAFMALGQVISPRRRGWFWAVLFGLWVFLPFAIFLPNWTGVYPHYFIPNLPLMALLAAVGLDWLLERLAPRAALRVALMGVFGIAVLTQGWAYLRFLQNIDNVLPELQPTPVHYLMSVRDALKPYDDVLIAGGTTGESGQPVWKALLYNSAECVRELVIASGGIAVFPEGPFALLTAPNALPPATGDLYESENSTTYPLRPGEGSYTITPFDNAPEWNGPEMQPVHLARFDNGVELTGYHLEENRIYLQWKLPGQGERAYQYFAHFLDSAGEKIGQQDASFYPEYFWCAGDTIITWIEADVPTETVTLRVGMYTLENDRFVNSQLVDDAGNPTLPWADITLSAPDSSE